MKFNTAIPYEAKRASEYLRRLHEKKNIVEVKRVSPVRSLSQNSYLHVTFSIFGLESGYEASEAKTIYKRDVNPALFVYKKNGILFLRSTATLTTKEMSDSIEKWRKYAAEQGIDIPAPGDDEALRYWENEIEREGKYL